MRGASLPKWQGKAAYTIEPLSVHWSSSADN